MGRWNAKACMLVGSCNNVGRGVAELRVVEVLVATITLRRLSIRGVITLAFAYINLVLHMRWLYLAVSLQHYRLQFDRIYLNHHHPGVIILVPLASSKYQGWAGYTIPSHPTYIFKARILLCQQV